MLLNTTITVLLWYEITQMLAAFTRHPGTQQHGHSRVHVHGFSLQWLQCCQCIPGTWEYTAASVSNEEKHTVLNAAEKLVKDSSL